MKRLLTLLLIGLSLIVSSRAEEPVNYKLWDDGKLSWDDFQDTLSLKGVP